MYRPSFKKKSYHFFSLFVIFNTAQLTSQTPAAQTHLFQQFQQVTQTPQPHHTQASTIPRIRRTPVAQSQLQFQQALNTQTPHQDQQFQQQQQPGVQPHQQQQQQQNPFRLQNNRFSLQNAQPPTNLPTGMSQFGTPVIDATTVTSSMISTQGQRMMQIRAPRPLGTQLQQPGQLLPQAQIQHQQQLQQQQFQPQQQTIQQPGRTIPTLSNRGGASNVRGGLAGRGGGNPGNRGGRQF